MRRAVVALLLSIMMAALGAAGRPHHDGACSCVGGARHGCAACATLLHVDADVGSDDAGGGAGAPFRTVHRAQRAARALLRGGRAGRVAVRVAGAHALRAPLLLTEHDAGTTWQGAAGAQLHGGVRVPPTAFKAWKGRVLRADLSDFAGLRLGEIRGADSNAGPCLNDKAELYFNKARMTLARYPNVGSDRLSNFLRAAGGNPRALQYASADAPRVAQWAGDKDLWLHGYWAAEWADSYVKVRGMNVTNSSLLFDPATPPDYGTVRANARWYALNALSELDSDGEYYIDRAAKVLYFQPPGGKLSASDVVMLSNLSFVVKASGTSELSLNGIAINYGSAANVVWENVSDSSIKGCDLGATGGNALSVSGSRVTVSNNTLSWMGCMGVIVNGGNRTTLQRGEIVVEDNHIEHFSAWKRTYKPAIQWNGVGNTYRRNTVRDGPHTAAQGWGNDNVFDANTFDHLCYEVSDSGAWYSGRTWAARNNSVINNIFSDVQQRPHLGGSVQAIYNDDELSGNTFVNNTFVDCHDGIFIAGGRSHIVRGNRFIRVGGSGHDRPLGAPIHIDNRGRGAHRYCMPPDGVFWKELDALNYTNPPYSTHYPALVNLDRPCVPVHNVIEFNTYCGLPLGFADKDAAWFREQGSVLANNTEDASLCAAPATPAPPATPCTWNVSWTRSSHPGDMQAMVVRGAANDTFLFQSCTTKGAHGQGCVHTEHVGKGVRTLVDKYGEVVGYGTCCNHEIDTVVSATRVSC